MHDAFAKKFEEERPLRLDRLAGMRVKRTTSVQRTTAIFQEAGTSLILREAFFGVRRFSDFQRNLSISRSVLARRLASLVEQGIFERHPYQDRPERFEYRLTESGLELYPVFLAMKAWGDKWLGDDVEELVLVHQTCSHETTPRMTCSHCREPVAATEMSYHY